jgi:hypothetical protein
MRYQVGKGRSDKSEKIYIEISQELGLACERLPKGLDMD